MKILLTGASSFTGHWFARELALAGHEVCATLTARVEDYAGLRRERVSEVQRCCNVLASAPFGSDPFLEILRNGSAWDVLCHHGARVGDYRSDHFPVVEAVEANTFRASEVVSCFVAAGGKRVVASGSVFERGEGVGTEPRRAFSPYALAKGLSFDILEYWCSRASLPLTKFVIPNPFGPLEEPRFTDYLVSSWATGATPTVRTPDYVRDNIHVSLLAKWYIAAVESSSQAALSRVAPSGYAESQGAFARRYAGEVSRRLGVPCPLRLAKQEEFSEPLARTNTDTRLPAGYAWDEDTAWNAVAAQCKRRLRPELLGNGAPA